MLLNHQEHKVRTKSQKVYQYFTPMCGKINSVIAILSQYSILFTFTGINITRCTEHILAESLR